MPDELNTSSHRYYQRQNNYLLTRDSFSRDFMLDAATLSFDTATAARLFSAPGSRGFFYDFSDYSTMFGDTAGTTPVTGVGQSVGLVLDESRGLALGPELVANGDFSSGLTGWTLIGVGNTSAVSGGVAQITGTTSPGLRRSGILTVGRTYRVSLRIRRTAGSAAAFYTPPLLSAPTLTGDWQTVSYYGVATAVDFEVGLSGTATGTTLEVDDISVRELPGNHATQATAGSRALTQVRPMFTQRNRAVGSDLPGNSFYWQVSATNNGVTYTRVATGIDTDGLPYADYSVVGTATADSFFETQNSTTQRIPAATGQTWTVSMFARRLSGAAPSAGEGVIPYIRGETAPSTITETSTLLYSPANTETLLSTTFTLANAATNQIRSSVSFRVAAGNTANYTMRVKGYQLELGSARTTYQPAVSGELRNLMFASGNPLLWVGTGTTNGITINRIATGVDAAGLPYADYSVSGTATAADFRLLVGGPSTRPAIVGQTFTSSVYVERLAGTAPPAGCGVYTEVAELGAGGTFLAGTATAPQDAPAPEAFRTVTRTLSNASLVDVRGGVVITTQSGATVNYTVRIKAPQFEQASTYSRYQRTITANEWYEPGFTSYRGIQFDGSDDFLQTAAIDFAGAGISGSNILTGSWTLTVDGGTATATESPAGTLNLTGDGTNGANARQAVTTEVGKQYRVDCAVGSSAISIFIGTTSGGNNIFPTTTLNTGVNCVYFTATTTTSHITFRKAGAALSTTSGITVREAIVPADKMTVVAGVRKLSDAGNGTLVELTANPDTINGSFSVRAPGTAPNRYAFRSFGTVGPIAAVTTLFDAPNTAVLTGQGDISGDISSLRHNGVVVSTATSDQGTGNYANAAAFIGRGFGGTTNPLNGVLTFLCVINRTLTADDLALLETIANSRTGAY